MRFSVFLILSLFLSLVSISLAQECGEEFGGKICDDDLCCSKWGYCGSTPDHCGEGCQSQCDGGDDDDDDSGGGDDDDGGGDGSKLSRLIPKETFEELLKHRNDAACPAKGFYTYSAFLSAAKSFPDFANSSDEATNKREIAAFLAQTSHETTGGWPTAPDGPNAWGYCFIEEVNGHLLPQGTYCDANYPCPQSNYYGRGPMQLSWNYNYRQCGTDLKEDLINNPDLLSKDAIFSFKSALWFWMTPQSPKPSCHDVIIGNWNPSSADVSANRLPGFGVTTNIINGDLECGFGPDSRVVDRIGFYKRYCDIFGVEYGNSLDCYDQPPFGSGLKRVASVVDM